MSTIRTEAIFENGVFRPLNGTPELREGQRVQLVIDTPAEVLPDVIKLAAEVYEGLSEEEIAEIEQIALDRSNFFGDRSEP